DLQKLSEIVVSKFGSSINAWVIEASVFNGPFAVYKDFISSVNQYGEPGTLLRTFCASLFSRGVLCLLKLFPVWRMIDWISWEATQPKVPPIPASKR
ncbi:hypothetical protein L195_g036210, partial [Trifolium pratense]